MASQRSSSASIQSDREDSLFTISSPFQRRRRADTTTTNSLATIHNLIGSSGQAPSKPRILSSVGSEGSGCCRSTRDVTSPIGDSFLFPQLLSLPGEPSLKHRTENSPNSRKTSSSFSDHESSLTPFSPSVRYRVDSATLFGDVDSRSSPRPSSQIKGHQLPKVDRRPPLPPKTAGRQGSVSTTSTSSVNQARVAGQRATPGQPYAGKGNVWPGMKLPLHGPTPKRVDLNASFGSTLSQLSEESSCTSPESSPTAPFLLQPATRSTITSGRDEVLKSDLTPFPPGISHHTVPTFLIPQETTLTVAGRNGGQQPLRKISTDGFSFSHNTMQTPPTPPAPNISVKRQFWDDDIRRSPRKRISVGSGSELEDSSSACSTDQSSSSLYSRSNSSGQSSCCSTGPDSLPSEPVYRIRSSTPKLGTVPYGLKSVTPIVKDSEQSQRFYEKGSPSVYYGSQDTLDNFSDSSSFLGNGTSRQNYTSSNFDSSSSLGNKPSSEHYTSSNFDSSSQNSASDGSRRRHSVSSVQSPPKDITSPSRQSRLSSLPDTPPEEVKRRRAELDIDYGKLLRPFPGRPPKGTVDSVQSLTCCSFHKFINEQDVALVMFYDGNKGKPDVIDTFKSHTLKIPQNTIPAFASVDCAAESQLCANEGIRAHPFYKLYVDGYLVSAVKDFGLLNYS